MQVDFYHLVASPLERVLPTIAQKVLDGGARLLIVSGDPQQRASIDALLWTFSADSFLPHAQAGSATDEIQPVLIAEEPTPSNNARNVALADGLWREAALHFDRAFHFFDGERIGEARQAWKSLADRAEVTRNYWKQNEAGRWERAA